MRTNKAFLCSIHYWLLFASLCGVVVGLAKSFLWCNDVFLHMNVNVYELTIHTQYAIWAPCDVALLYAMPQHSYYSKPMQSSVLIQQPGILKLKRHKGLQVCVKLGTGVLDKFSLCFIVTQFHTTTESLLHVVLMHSQMSLSFTVAGVNHMPPIIHLSSASHWDHAFGILL